MTLTYIPKLVGLAGSLLQSSSPDHGSGKRGQNSQGHQQGHLDRHRQHLLDSVHCGKSFVRGYKQYFILGSDCGPVGRAVASDTSGPRFESTPYRDLLFYFTSFNH